MEIYEKILFLINQKKTRNQRDLASAAGISLGKVNYSLKEMTEKGYLCKKDNFYGMTARGEMLLEDYRMRYQEEKMELPFSDARVKLAVILAAGENGAFDRPEGLLTVGGKPLIEHLILALVNQGIERIVLVVGSRKEQYLKYFENKKVILVENSQYQWTGTMASLLSAQEYLTEDFLLVEGNQILEESAIELIQQTDKNNGMLLVGPSGSKDTAYVELDEEGCIFRISKDIKQLNRIDAELTGVCRISSPLFQKMKKYYEKNNNPFLNYEYAIESIGRAYRIYNIWADDLLWSVIEDQEMYQKAENILYPRMKKRAILRKENKAREILMSCLDISEKAVEQVQIGGGMTNLNFYTQISGKEYILRVPGACTQRMINRGKEMHNSLEASRAGMNPPILYFNEETGIKITEYIKGAETLNPGSARLQKNMSRTMKLLKDLHVSSMDMEGEFDPWQEYQKYRTILKENGGKIYPEFEEMEEYFYTLRDKLYEMGWKKCPCHNDLVAENFVSSQAGRMYLIDWEYAGRNDPMWDLASHFLECSFTKAEEEFYLNSYFAGPVPPYEYQKILLFKITQDFLWSAWTIMKEAEGEDFGTYGQERFLSAKTLRKEYEEKYERAR